MQIAERVHALAQEQNDARLMLGAYANCATTFYFLGEFETTRQYARQGVQLWRSGGVQSYAEEYLMPVVTCLIYWAMSEWHFGEIASCHALMEEAISIAKELKDMNSLAMALSFAAALAYFARDPAEADRFASELTELSTRHNFVHWLAHAESYRGWARSALGNPAEGISWIEQEIRDYRATGAVLGLPTHLARKAKALHLAGRTSEALEAINEVEALVERFENRYWSAELHRLRGVFLAALGADETQIETSFQEAIRTAKEQKSVSLVRRAKESYAEWRTGKEQPR
ncbi:MAG TPA: hypothetical protein VE641_15835 [Chthoniobacterales bacterium]|nr:hypothetical protein [Chthoniobacterales bacterium]